MSPFVDVAPTQAQVVIDDDGSLGREYCEDEENCDIRVRIADGKKIVIVNGDTVQTSDIIDDEFTLDDDHPMLHRKRNRIVWGGPHINGFALFGGGLENLEELEGLDDLKILADPHLGIEWNFETLRDRTLRKLERKARDLAEKARKADGEERDELEAELHELLGEIFDYKLDKRRRTIENDEERLAKRRERLNERSTARDDIIEQRKRELLGEKSYLEW